MTCEECGREFQSLRCACGWQAPQLAVQHDPPAWTVRECEAAGCTAMIRERPGAVGSRFCKWCQANGITTAKVARIDARTPYLSREQFGLDLYDTIRRFGALDQVRQEFKRVCTADGLTVEARKRRLDELRKFDTEMTKKITALMETLNPDDVRRLLSQFEAGTVAS